MAEATIYITAGLPIPKDNETTTGDGTVFMTAGFTPQEQSSSPTEASEASELMLILNF
jgi:hypothetical protein